MGADRAARETIATFPGLKAKTPEDFLKNWDKISGKGDKPYLAENTFDQIKYIVHEAYGTEMQELSNFGPSAK